MIENIELKRFIYDFNYIVGRINKAESISQEKLNKYSEAGYMKLVKVLQELIKQAGEFEIKIKRITGRELTNYERLNGIDIKAVFSWKLKI